MSDQITVNMAPELVAQWLRAQGYTVVAPKPSDQAAPHFDTFWADYPRKMNKAAAIKAWNNATKSAAAGIIHAALCAQVNTGMFSDDPKYIPMASTWLNQARWENPVAPTQSKAPSLDALSKFMMED